MIASLEFIRLSFGKFNDLMFDGVLPPVRIVLSKARTFVGKMEYKVIRDRYGNVIGHSDYILKISTIFNFRQEELEDIIIHEMIHCYIAFRNIKDSSVHGKAFKHMMDAINAEFGRNISIRHNGNTLSGSASEQDSPSARIATRRMVCVSEFIDGKKGITVCTPAKTIAINFGLRQYSNILKLSWFASDDPFFESYPLSRKPRVYRINEEELAQHLSTAQPLSIKGFKLF